MGLSLHPSLCPNLANTAAKNSCMQTQRKQYRYRIQNTEYIIQNTEKRIQKFVYIKLQMYLFFYMALGLNDFDVGKSITQAIGRGGP